MPNPREELEAALNFVITRDSFFNGELGRASDLIEAAARMQLALMPEKCGTCGGVGERRIEDFPEFTTECPTCHGSGKVYPQVEQIWSNLGDNPYHVSREQIVAVLDALGET